MYYLYTTKRLNGQTTEDKLVGEYGSYNEAERAGLEYKPHRFVTMNVEGKERIGETPGFNITTIKVLE